MSLLPNASQVNNSTAFWLPASGGGGGGGGGANLNISTMAVNPTGEILFPNSGTQNGQIIGFTDTANNSTTTLSVTFPTGYIGVNSNSGLWTVENQDSFASIYYGDFCAGKFVVAGNNTGATGQLPYITAGTNGDMTIVGAASVNISTPSLLQNGVPIGGGGGGIQSTIANGAANISIPAGAVPMSFNMTEGASFTTPGNAGTLLMNGNILNNGTTAATFNNGVQATTLSTLNLQVSTINGAAPGGGSVPANLAVSSLTVSDQPTALSSICQIQGSDTNLYTLQVTDSNAALVTGMSIGLVGGRNQVYIDSNAQIGNQLWVSSIQNCKEAFVSSFNVSSINGAAPGGGLINQTVPFITGSGDGTTWTANVDSNTGGVAVQLTSTLITNSANSYLVSYSLFGGSNGDTSQYTKLSVYTAGGNPIIQTLPGLVSNNWLSNGFMGARSLIVSGAAAIRLEGENYSATTSTILYFDQGTLLRVTNLGASS